MTKELVDEVAREAAWEAFAQILEAGGDKTAAFTVRQVGPTGAVLEAQFAAFSRHAARQRNEGIEAAAKVADQAEKDWQEQPTRSDDQFGRALEETLAKATAKTCSIIATAIRALKEPE